MAPHELIEAVKAGDVPTIETHLAQDPSLGAARDDAGLSLILLALFHHQRAAADALLATGPELDILEAASTGDAERIRAILAADPGQLDARTPEGFDPIGLAAFLGGPDAVRALLEHGADPDGDPNNPMRARPVHAAAAEHDRESLRLLLEAGADPNAQQQGGFTALHAAAHSDDAEMAKLLLARGADPAVTLDDGRDAAAYAADRNSAAVAALLA
jgi:ankyrin repeat protein